MDIVKEQVDQLMSENRRTAEFHKSGGDYDQLDIIKDLAAKE